MSHCLRSVRAAANDGRRHDPHALDPESFGIVLRVLERHLVIEPCEAGIERELRRHFDSVDRDRDGVLDREALVDWDTAMRWRDEVWVTGALD